MNEQEHKLYLKKLKNCKGARYLTLFFINIYNRTSEEGFKREIFADDMDYNDILINEASKPIINENQTLFKNFLTNLDKSFHIDMINFDIEKKKKQRKVNLIYVSLLKFNGLVRYMLYQGLTKEDIRKISCYIKHQFFKKGEYIFRQYEKSDALYGIIKGKIQIRTVNFKDLTQKFHGDILKGEGFDDHKNLDNTVPINYFMSDVEIVNSSSESEENEGYFALRKKIEKEIMEKEKKDKEIQDKLKKTKEKIKSRKSLQRMKTTIFKSNFNIINSQNKTKKKNFLRLNTMKNFNKFDKEFNILNDNDNNKNENYNKPNFNRNKSNFKRMKTTIIKSKIEINNNSPKKYKRTNSMRKLILNNDSENTINFEENFSEKENNSNSKLKLNKSLSFRFDKKEQKNKTNSKRKINRLNTVNIKFNKNILKNKVKTSKFFKELNNDNNNLFEEKKEDKIFDFEPSEFEKENETIFIDDENKMIGNLIENKKKNFFFEKNDESNDFSFINDLKKDSISINSNSNSPINNKRRKVKFEVKIKNENKKEKSNFFNLFNENNKEKEEEPKTNNKKINKNFLHSKTIKIFDRLKKFQEKFFNEKEEEKNEKNNNEKNFDFTIKKSNLKRRKIIKSLQSQQTPENITEPKVLFNLIEDFESKKMNLIPGYCFGEWGLTYNIPRTTSIYCIEDTDVFYLEKKYFDKFLLKKFHLSDLKKIQFIYDRLPILKKNKKNLEHILTKITPFFFDEGDIVYTPYDNANTLYLIYLGECYLCEMPIKTTNKIDYLQKKDKLVRVSTITEGGMVGLESCLPEKKYEHCLYVVQNFTILLKIDTEYFQNLFENFKESLINLYYKHKNIMEEFHIRNEKVRKELNFKYRVIKNKKKQFFEEFYKDKDVVNGKNDKDIIHRINSSRIIKISETRNIFKKKLKKYQNKNDENKKNLKLNLKYFPSDKNQNKKNVVETENIKIPKLLLKSPIKLENKLFMTNFNTINAKDSKKNINTKNKNISFNNNVNEYHDSREINSSKNINKKKIKLNFFRNKSIDTNKRLNSRNKFFNSPIKNQNFDSITNFSSTKTKSNMTSVNFKKKLSNFPKINSLNNASSYFNNSNVSNSISYNKNNNNNNISHKRVTSFDSGLFNIPFVTSFLK